MTYRLETQTGEFVGHIWDNSSDNSLKANKYIGEVTSISNKDVHICLNGRLCIMPCDAYGAKIEEK